MCCAFLQHGWTALHVAALHNSVDVIELLLTKDSTLITQTDKVSEQTVQFIMFKSISIKSLLV